MNLKKAFSLLELMIVILILGLLAGVVMPNLLSKGEKAKRDLACVQMKTIYEALKQFKWDNGVFPSTQEGIKALIKNPNEQKFTKYDKNGYLDAKRVPRDPWDSEYIYIKNSNEIELVSLGPDKKEGGTGEETDIRFPACQEK